MTAVGSRAGSPLVARQHSGWVLGTVRHAEERGRWPTAVTGRNGKPRLSRRGAEKAPAVTAREKNPGRHREARKTTAVIARSEAPKQSRNASRALPEASGTQRAGVCQQSASRGLRDPACCGAPAERVPGPRDASRQRYEIASAGCAGLAMTAVG